MIIIIYNNHTLISLDYSYYAEWEKWDQLSNWVGTLSYLLVLGEIIVSREILKDRSGSKPKKSGRGTTVEHMTSNQKAVSSIPTIYIMFYVFSIWEEFQRPR